MKLLGVPSGTRSCRHTCAVRPRRCGRRCIRSRCCRTARSWPPCASRSADRCADRERAACGGMLCDGETMRTHGILHVYPNCPSPDCSGLAAQCPKLVGTLGILGWGSCGRAARDSASLWRTNAQEPGCRGACQIAAATPGPGRGAGPGPTRKSRSDASWGREPVARRLHCSEPGSLDRCAPGSAAATANQQPTCTGKPRPPLPVAAAHPSARRQFRPPSQHLSSERPSPEDSLAGSHETISKRAQHNYMVCKAAPCQPRRVSAPLHRPSPTGEELGSNLVPWVAVAPPTP
jgi:hypothetical protein